MRPRGTGISRGLVGGDGAHLSAAEREALVIQFDDLAHKLARIAERAGDDYDDALSDAYVGLWRATQTFDPGKGFKFMTYAYAGIRQAIWQGRLRRIRHETLSGLGITGLHDGMSTSGSEAGRDGVDAADFADEALALLNCRQQRIVLQRLGGDNLREISEREGVTHETVRTYFESAMKQLRAEFCTAAEAAA